MFHLKKVASMTYRFKSRTPRLQPSQEILALRPTYQYPYPVDLVDLSPPIPHQILKLCNNEGRSFLILESGAKDRMLRSLGRKLEKITDLSPEAAASIEEQVSFLKTIIGAVPYPTAVVATALAILEREGAKEVIADQNEPFEYAALGLFMLAQTKLGLGALKIQEDILGEYIEFWDRLSVKKQLYVSLCEVVDVLGRYYGTKRFYTKRPHPITPMDLDSDDECESFCSSFVNAPAKSRRFSFAMMFGGGNEKVQGRVWRGRVR